MVERRGRTRFLLEAAQPIGIGTERRRQHLDRHLAPEPWIARAIDLPHPARAEGGLDLVRGEAGTGVRAIAGLKIGRRSPRDYRAPEEWRKTGIRERGAQLAGSRRAQA